MVLTNRKESSLMIGFDHLKKQAFTLVEHLGELASNSKERRLVEVVFELVFSRTPRYDEIANRTAPIYPIFALSSQEKIPPEGNSTRNLRWQLVFERVRNAILTR